MSVAPVIVFKLIKALEETQGVGLGTPIKLTYLVAQAFQPVLARA
jgi:hypothetical protein